MPTTYEPEQSQDLVELQGWYVEGLRPKLARAAESGDVEPAAVAELDRRVCELLSLPGAHDDQVA
jgi:hypothetical protein